MSFFSLSVDDQTGQQKWVMSQKFWIYWVITIPLTIVTLLCWTYGQRELAAKRLKAWKERPSKA
jgi:hypothetical protein